MLANFLLPGNNNFTRAIFYRYQVADFSKSLKKKEKKTGALFDENFIYSEFPIVLPNNNTAKLQTPEFHECARHCEDEGHIGIRIYINLYKYIYMYLKSACKRDALHDST